MNNNIYPDYCSIRDGRVKVNGITLFTNESAESDEPLLTRIYKAAGLSYPKFYKMDNLSKTGYLAAEYLLKGTAIDTPELKPGTSLILMNKNASLDTDINFQATINDPSSYFPSPSIFVYTLPNIMLGEICIRFKISGEGAVFISDEIDNKLFYDYIARLISEGKTENCIFGWIDYYSGIPEAFLSIVQTKDFNNTFDVDSFDSFIKRSL